MTIPFERIRPTKKNQWLEISENDFGTLLPLVVKSKKGNSIINIYSNGLSTNRDEWVYDFSNNSLQNKIKYFLEEYNNEVKRWIEYKIQNNYQDIKAESNPIVDNFLAEHNFIKWSKMIKRDKLRKEKLANYQEEDIRPTLYRPFSKRFLYFGYIPIDMRGSFLSFYPQSNSQNKTVSISNSERTPLSLLASDTITDLNLFMPAPVFSFALYAYNNGERMENISDWAFNKFIKQYGKKGISKEAIFHYVYAVLHNPAYRKKYELNLKREFPRIPFYENFKQWSEWGEALMNLHINYETVQPFELKELSTDHKENPKAKLKADKENGTIILDENTILTGIPKEAWTYKLGNRSALEWVLDQHKEKKPKDPTIAEKFNTYKFADYKPQVIDLLKRVCTVSVETMKIIEEMNLGNK